MRDLEDKPSGYEELGMKRILLVEDHTFFRSALAILLEYQPNLQVTQAGSLAEAREELDGRFDVAVVDLALPDGDGRELIGELRQSSPGISVLVLSSNIMAEDFDDVRRTGADMILNKVEYALNIVEKVRRLADG